MNFEFRTAQRDIEGLRELTCVYLGGSRRMAQRALNECEPAVNIVVDEHTDHDYYTTYSDKTITYLIMHGWKSIRTKPKYFDSEAVSILEKDNYQIVLRRDAEFYHNVFEHIPVWFYHDYLWKRNPDVISERIQPILEAFFGIRRS